MGLLATDPHKQTNGTPATSIRSYAPATGELLGEVHVASRDEVMKVVARARRAQQAWGVLPVEERCARLLRFRDAIAERTTEVVDLLTRECGKPKHEALVFEVVGTLDLLTYYAKTAPKALAPREISMHLMVHKRTVAHYHPRGVVGVISPWNFPWAISLGDAIAALVTGSAVVIKPSEVTPLSVQKAKEIWDTTGLPEDLFAVVQGYGATGQALIESGIQKLCFTGGVETGKRVAAACGARLIPCVMELGGKAPLLACADADIEKTARAIVFGGFANAGQVCISVERVYAHRAIYEPLVRRVKELTLDLRVGDPADAIVEVGAIIFPRQIEIAEKHIADAVKKGAEIVTGGKRREGPGQFFEPTVLAGCTPDMTVMREEIFGPIVPIQRVETDEEALKLANDSHLGLNAYVFTKDRAKGRRLAERIEAGSVLVNDVLANYGCCEVPFGGVKESGFGRVHGDDALRDMAEKRVVLEDRIPMPAQNPLAFPYGPASLRWYTRAARAAFGGGSILKRIGELF
jgi:succinate-semialdehyde dehydrogenase/glutarate-semialdehyde dehydrogenase